tara:strand:- start:556 stop:894 length:339 start_codon:yes stop_codon:yes gene_type:complete
MDTTHENLAYRNIDAFSKINLKEESNFVRNIYFLLKICFFLLATVSLLKIGYVSKIRLIRLQEIKNSYLYEKTKFIDLTRRFDQLFSLKGEQRFMKDQDQIISKDILRVIWR